MHFSKTYAQLLLTLPPELRQSAIQYRELKKIINQIVAELTSLGLSPDILHNVLQPPHAVAADKGKQREGLPPPASLDLAPSPAGPRVIYELVNVADHLEPRLRLYLSNGPAVQQDSSDLGSRPHLTVFEALNYQVHEGLTIDPRPSTSSELIIPLASDTAFFRTLSDALDALSLHLVTKRAEFQSTVATLSRDISAASRPSSSTRPSFQPYSAFSSDPANISVSSTTLVLSTKSDLHTWRQIFQLYVESDIFQGHQEAFRGERDVGDAETRLVAFCTQLQERLSNGTLKLKLKQSQVALKTFLELNTFILDMRKFQHVTSEATRKILKKHAKRTALPLAPDLSSPFAVALDTHDGHSGPLVHTRPPTQRTESFSLSLVLAQALTETLLPIIPHIDDYSCIICTSLAFKPIRLQCSHLFCVRCLVKLQKRGEEHCPVCRALTVLSADRSNVDWALLNFMKDWFPMEARRKLQQNEREAAEEDMKELGLDVRGCVAM